MTAAIHHLEVCVADLERNTSLFLNKFGFSLICSKRDNSVNQNVVQAGQCTIVLTKKKHNPTTGSAIVSCCKDGDHLRDSVFNMACEVKDVHKFCDNFTKNGGKILHSPSTLSDEFGSVQFAQVQSICGNIIHTVLNKDGYTGRFLPGYDHRPLQDPIEPLGFIDYMDHVTFVCQTGQMDSVIDFYEKTFGMKRFMINRQDDEVEGLVIKSNVGMRLKVMDYWQCAEVGLKFGLEKKISIVLAESLSSQEKCHIQTFLDEHHGPGIQHIGLHTSQIATCVEKLLGRDVQFRKPPGAYYSSVGKLDEILEAGENVDEFRKFGILIDAEADALEKRDSLTETEAQKTKKYLLQIFTMPIFCQDTFFLEVIQRKGATGFGAGNVTALARSIEEENSIVLS